MQMHLCHPFPNVLEACIKALPDILRQSLPLCTLFHPERMKLADSGSENRLEGGRGRREAASHRAFSPRRSSLSASPPSVSVEQSQQSVP